MSTYESKITLREDNIREILAEYFGVKPDKVHFHIVEGGQLDARYVNCDIIKEMEFPIKEGTTSMPWLNKPGARSTEKEA